MPTVTKDQVMDQLRTVMDPELHKDLVSLNMVKNVAVCDGLVKVHVELTTPACPLKDTIGKDVTDAVERIDGVQGVELEWSAQVRAHQQTQNKLPGVKNVIPNIGDRQINAITDANPDFWWSSTLESASTKQ